MQLCGFWLYVAENLTSRSPRTPCTCHSFPTTFIMESGLESKLFNKPVFAQAELWKKKKIQSKLFLFSSLYWKSPKGHLQCWGRLQIHPRYFNYTVALGSAMSWSKMVYPNVTSQILPKTRSQSSWPTVHSDHF